MEERDDIGEGRMGQKRMGSGVVGVERCVFRRREQEMGRRLCSPIKRKTSFGYGGHSDRGLCVFVGRILFLYCHDVDTWKGGLILVEGAGAGEVMQKRWDSRAAFWLSFLLPT